MATHQIGYGTQVQPTFGIGSLATSPTLTVGYETSAVDNTTVKATDYIVSGKTMTGATPRDGGTIELWVIPEIEATPAYPAPFDGTASAETVTRDVLESCGVKCATITVGATPSTAYYIAPFPLAAVLGGWVPPHFVFFVTQNTGAALHATAGNHALNLRPILATTA